VVLVLAEKVERLGISIQASLSSPKKKGYRQEAEQQSWRIIKSIRSTEHLVSSQDRLPIGDWRMHMRCRHGKRAPTEKQTRPDQETRCNGIDKQTAYLWGKSSFCYNKERLFAGEIRNQRLLGL
jgi:hypothetical protein